MSQTHNLDSAILLSLCQSVLRRDRLISSSSRNQQEVFALPDRFACRLPGLSLPRLSEEERLLGLQLARVAMSVVGREGESLAADAERGVPLGCERLLAVQFAKMAMRC